MYILDLSWSLMEFCFKACFHARVSVSVRRSPPPSKLTVARHTLVVFDRMCFHARDSDSVTVVVKRAARSPA